MRKLTNREVVARFWSHVNKTGGCWLWVGGRRGEYGRHYTGNRRYVGAHVYSYRLHCGPTRGLIVRHTCDTPLCVRPDHLLLGTYQDNRDDCVSRLRHAFGSKNGNAKLTEDEAGAVRYLCGLGWWDQKTIGGWFGIKQPMVSRIWRGRFWTR